MKNKYQYRAGLYWRFNPQRISWEIKLNIDENAVGALGMHFNALLYSLEEALAKFSDEANKIESINGHAFEKTTEWDDGSKIQRI